MNQLLAIEYVQRESNNLHTTSRIVAEKFSKRHADVIRNIKQLTQQVGERNFAPTPYTDSQGKDQIEYKITQKGFMLLAMRFTGPDALKIQIAFVDAFEAMSKELKDLKKNPFIEAEAMFRPLHSLAMMFGLDQNQALLSASGAVKRQIGVDIHGLLQIELKSPNQERYLTPTELGSPLGLSPQKVNKMLESKGFQVKKSGLWIITSEGKKYSVILDTSKKNATGTSVQQIKWLESVADIIGLS